MIEERDFARPAKTSLRCPKCGSRSLTLVESATWTTEWNVVDGAFDRAEGYSNPVSIDRLDAHCVKCAHNWKPRRAWQVDDVCVEIENSDEEEVARSPRG